MKTTVYSFDPGQTTGFCEIEIFADGKDFEVKRALEISWWEALPVLYDLIETMPEGAHVVIEQFRLFPNKAKAQIGSQFPSTEVIGIIEAFLYIRGVEPKDIRFREPSEIQRVEVLERDIRHVAGSAHKIDAYKHARLYFLKHFRKNPFDASSPRVTGTDSESLPTER